MLIILCNELQTPTKTTVRDPQIPTIRAFCFPDIRAFILMEQILEIILMSGYVRAWGRKDHELCLITSSLEGQIASQSTGNNLIYMDRRVDLFFFDVYTYK